MKRVIIVLWILQLSRMRLCVAQSIGATEEADIARELASTDQTIVAKALDRVHALAKDYPDQVASPLRRSWLVALARKGLNDDIIDLTQAAILANPGAQLVVESMLRQRIYALSALNRSTEAEADARRLYNVISLDQTHVAVVMLAASLSSKLNPPSSEALHHFQVEQARAATSPADGSQYIDKGSLLNPGEAVNPEPYASHAALWATNRNHAAYGNMLLMAGDVDAARLYFNGQLAKSKTDREMSANLERVAACIRAKEGNVAGAYQYLQSIIEAGSP